jgi:hypothetical protein
MRQIKDYPNYLISLDGNVFSLTSMKWLKTNKKSNSYQQVELFNDNGSKHLLVHRLVAEAYMLNNEQKKTVNHIDGNKSNNSLLNLEWSTYSENMKHAFRTGLKYHNENQRKAISNVGKRVGAENGRKASEKRKKLIIDVATGIFYNGIKEAAETINVKKTTLNAMLIGQNKNRTNYKYV